LLARIYREQKGITGLETAIILIAFVVVAAVSANSILSAGLFSADKSREAINSGLQEIQGTLEIRGDIVGYRDTLNAGGSGSLGKIEFTVIVYSAGDQIDLTPAYMIDPGTGALIHSNPGVNKLQITFNDQNAILADCAWTAAWIGKNNDDNILDSREKAVITVWLHAFNGTDWGPVGSEGSPFLGTHYVDTYHKYTLEIKSAKGAVVTIERTTPAYLDSVVNMH
jgi:archaeal flagellin FlaB